MVELPEPQAEPNADDDEDQPLKYETFAFQPFDFDDTGSNTTGPTPEVLADALPEVDSSALPATIVRRELAALAKRRDGSGRRGRAGFGGRVVGCASASEGRGSKSRGFESRSCENPGPTSIGYRARASRRFFVTFSERHYSQFQLQRQPDESVKARCGFGASDCCVT